MEEVKEENVIDENKTALDGFELVRHYSDTMAATGIFYYGTWPIGHFNETNLKIPQCFMANDPKRPFMYRVPEGIHKGRLCEPTIERNYFHYRFDELSKDSEILLGLEHYGNFTLGYFIEEKEHASNNLATLSGSTGVLALAKLLPDAVFRVYDRPAGIEQQEIEEETPEGETIN